MNEVLLRPDLKECLRFSRFSPSSQVPFTLHWACVALCTSVPFSLRYNHKCEYSCRRLPRPDVFAPVFVHLEELLAGSVRETVFLRRRQWNLPTDFSLSLSQFVGPSASRRVLTSNSVRNKWQGNQIHSGIVWCLNIPQMYVGTIGYN